MSLTQTIPEKISLSGNSTVMRISGGNAFDYAGVAQVYELDNRQLG